MLALVHNILPPYRVPFFNAISDACEGEFVVLLARDTHAYRRSWRVPWEDVSFHHVRLRTLTLRIRQRAVDLSFGVGAALTRAHPDAIVVAGWDLPACWLALVWARRRRVPAYAWVESGATSGRLRGPVSMKVRRSFLQRCQGAIVPGEAAANFVTSLVPGLRCVTVPNSVGIPTNPVSRDPKPPWSAIFVGELSARKGFDIVLKAIPELLTDFEMLTVVGSGPLAGEIREIDRRDARVRYLGFVEGESLVSAMKAASVMLVPSRQDPWPLVAVEALTVGCPVALGPGVGSSIDLEALAGASAARMEAPSASCLVAAARRARAHTVPLRAREAFQPQLAAARFVSILTG